MHLVLLSKQPMKCNRTFNTLQYHFMNCMQYGVWLLLFVAYENAFVKYQQNEMENQIEIKFNLCNLFLRWEHKQITRVRSRKLHDRVKLKLVCESLKFKTDAAILNVPCCVCVLIVSGVCQGINTPVCEYTAASMWTKSSEFRK